MSAPGKGTAAPDLSGLAGVPAEMFLLASQVVVWGYPAVKFEQLMQVRTTEAILAMGNPRSAVNQLGLVRSLRGPEFKQIATPNNDTLYAQSFCDVSREPLVLSVPEVEADRYYTFQLWDPNGDTFGYVGSRTTGHAAGHQANNVAAGPVHLLRCDVAGGRVEKAAVVNFDAHGKALCFD